VAKQVDIRTPKESVILDIRWAVDDAGVKEETGLDEPTVRQSIFLDMNESGGLALGKGKNVQLGKLREALGLNDPAKAFSFAQIVGRPARIAVIHDMYNNEPQAKVKAVTKA
jgi:hypothetical protein